MTEQARSNWKTSLDGYRIHPELSGIFLRRSSGLLVLLVVLLTIVVPSTAMEAGSGKFQPVTLMVLAFLLLILIRQIMDRWSQFARVTKQLECGHAEQVELLLERRGNGLVAKVRSALDFSVGARSEWDIYFADAGSEKLFEEDKLGQTMILPAFYGFDPDAPLLLRTPKGLLWLDNKDAERIDESATLLLRAYSCYRNNRDREAIAYLDQSLSVNPKYIDALELRGYCKQRLGFGAECIEDFTAVVNERAKSLPGVKDMAASYLARAGAYMQIGDSEKAVADLNIAIELTPDNADLYYVRTSANEELGNNAAAVADATRYLELMQDTLPPEDRAGMLIHRAMNQTNDHAAFKDLDEAIKIYPSALAFYFRACLHHRQDRLTEVIDQCSKALELDAGYEPALELRSEAYANSGNPNAAQRDISAISALRQNKAESMVQSLELPPDPTMDDAAPPGIFEPPASSHSASVFEEKLGALLTGAGWRVSFGTFGVMAICSREVMTATTKSGLAGLGESITVWTTLFLITSIIQYLFVRIARGVTTLRNTAVLVAWAMTIHIVCAWIMPDNLWSISIPSVLLAAGVNKKLQLPLPLAIATVLATLGIIFGIVSLIHFLKL